MTLIYKSLRVGKGGTNFYLYKLRTMTSDGGTPTASSNDPRLTKIGKLLRRFKIDELPSLYNVLKGDIEIVGPRPDVPSEIETLDEETRVTVLSVKPGIISPATLWNISEDAILSGELNPHQVYLEKIKPTKYALNVWYVSKKSFWFDMKVIISFFLKMAGVKTLNIFPKE